MSTTATTTRLHNPRNMLSPSGPHRLSSVATHFTVSFRRCLRPTSPPSSLQVPIKSQNTLVDHNLSSPTRRPPSSPNSPSSAPRTRRAHILALLASICRLTLWFWSLFEAPCLDLHSIQLAIDWPAYGWIRSRFSPL